MTGDREKLVKIFVELPNHWLWKSESMWARALGHDLYELHNSPFCAYGLNYKDVVVAVAESPSEKPRIRRLERHGRHRTLRFRFAEEIDRAQREGLLERMTVMGTSFEGHEYRFFALDIPPSTDYETVCVQLSAWQSQGILEYETCEARMPDSFDDLPDQDADAAELQ